MSGAEVAIALDAGGTKLAGGLVAGDGRVLHEEERRTPVAGGERDPGLRALAQLAADLADRARRGGLDVTGLGAGLPEYVDPAGRLTSREVLAWTIQPAELLAAVVPGKPCVVDADVRCGARAEALAGAGAGLDGFLYVSLGTGLSSALVLGARPLAGRRGEAIALGELDVPAAVDPAWPANLEDFASGEGVRRRYEAATGEDPGGGRGVHERAAAGDPRAAAILETAGRALGRVLAGLTAVLDPPAIVLGGGLGTAAGPLHDALEQAYAAALARRPGGAPLRPAALGARAGLLGAGLLVTGAPPPPAGTV